MIRTLVEHDKVPLNFLVSRLSAHPHPLAAPGAPDPSLHAFPSRDTLERLQVFLFMQGPKLPPGFEMRTHQWSHRTVTALVLWPHHCHWPPWAPGHTWACVQPLHTMDLSQPLIPSLLHGVFVTQVQDQSLHPMESHPIALWTIQQGNAVLEALLLLTWPTSAGQEGSGTKSRKG